MLHDICGTVSFFFFSLTLLKFTMLQSGLKFLPKLTSDTVGEVLAHFGPPEVAGTANLMMEIFLDCLNGRNTTEHELKRKPFS